MTTAAGSIILQPYQRTGDVAPLDRLHRAGSYGLPCGTIRDGGLRVDVAENLEARGLARLERAPVDPGANYPWRGRGRPVRAFAAQLDLFDRA